ncbi:MAG: hypothetical protein I8H67_09020 [Comamonadaceae bacterium]|nr:hypothetical protein [Comamonadaceae bacterium]
MATLECRLLALERTHKPPARYALPLPPGRRRLPVLVLVLRGPDELAELAAARASGYVAELDTPENNARFLG